MNSIDLFKGEQKKEEGLTENNSRIHAKRPEEIKISKPLPPITNRWRECKIIGKNIEIRSYSAACAFNQELYVYGGYQILRGNMADFYKINLDDSVGKFDWQAIEAKGTKPGPRSKHALISSKQKIFLIGGLCTDIFSSNQIHCFDPQAQQWSEMKPGGERLPEIDSFGSVYLEKDGEERIVILCGWDGAKAEYLNSVYEYNITKNCVSILYQGSQQPKEDMPNPRSGCAAASDGKNVYIFGGKDTEHRMNDLWEFNMIQFKFRQLDKKGDIPPQRNGHTMQYFQSRLYVFGGIHDITWELDDLHIYHLERKEWTTLEQDSPRKIEKKKKIPQEASSQEKKEKKSPKKKNFNNFTLYANKTSLTENSPTRKNYQTFFKEDDEQASPGKMIDEQRKKAFLQRKAEMLKNFEIDNEEAQKFVKLETASQAMKNSLDVIGNPDPKQKLQAGKLTDFGRQTHSKFLDPLENNSNLILGKKPCARDGHCSVFLNDELIIFGGDRHQMSFSDIYKLNFEGQ